MYLTANGFRRGVFKAVFWSGLVLVFISTDINTKMWAVHKLKFKLRN